MLIDHTVIQTHFRVILCGALACVFLCVFVSLLFGSVALTLSDVLLCFINTEHMHAKTIIIEVRLPRILLAVLIGAMLATCGVVTQGLFRNPLADPSIIGVSAGASAGASFVIVIFHYLNWQFLGLSMVSLGAFLGSIIAVVCVYKLAVTERGVSITTLLLAGVAFTFFAGSIASFFEFMADNDMLKRISLWRMGGLDGVHYSHVFIALFAGLFLLFFMPRHVNALNALLLGESQARHLGININRTKRTLIICVALGVGVSVALVGTIAFVGLVVPHLVRLFVGANHRYLLPLSACVGACLLVIADTIARILFVPEEMPVGLITSLIGAPLFIFLLKNIIHSGSRT